MVSSVIGIPCKGAAFHGTQVIDMGDDMHFEVLPGATNDELVCNMEGVPLDDSNLVIKVRE